MEFFGFFQDCTIIFIILCCRLTFACWVYLFPAYRRLKKIGLDCPSSSVQVMDMASSSSAAAATTADIIPPPPGKYDVFISFRGEDTRVTFTSHLHAALLRKKLETYIDYRLERGGEIGPALLEAIQKSALSVVIFSQNYASSTWCLDELAHILECKERNGQFIIPIFYDINPSHVRKQQGSYAVAFGQLEQRFKENINKVDKWRAALTNATNLSGFDNSNKTRTEANLVEEVVNDILTKFDHQSSSDLEGLVGIESRIEQIESLLCINDSLEVCTVGIWGMGGIGKTTLADAVFHRLSSKFEASCFLANVREESEKHGLNHLRNVLFRKLLNDKGLTISTPSIGSSHFKKRLRVTNVLIVLDDVNDSGQLELLHSDDVQFGPGSRIIITTRDRSQLNGRIADDNIYEVKGLKHDEALQLFRSHAFKNKSCRTDYTEVSRKVVDYLSGIPLALKTLGSLFLPCKRQEDWEEEFYKLKKFPSKKIQNVLRLSYNLLEENEKEIFLDIACFLKGMDIGSAKRMLDTRGFFAGRGIQILIHKSLISISTRNCLEMHDLLVEMGRAIVREQCFEEPGERNRLCTNEDVYHVLKGKTGTAKVEFISFDLSQIRDKQLSAAALKKMDNLRFLRVREPSPYYHQNKTYKKSHLSQGLSNALRYLYWNEYPLNSLPSTFSPENLVELRMPYSQVAQLWNKVNQNLVHLRVIDLNNCIHLTKVPDLSQSRKIEHIDLHGCRILDQVPSYFQYLDKLAYLDLGSCLSLKFIPEMPCNIEFLSLGGSGIEELPSSIWSHEKISILDIGYCKSLKNLPHGSCKLKVSGKFSLKGCKSLGKLGKLPRYITGLNLSGTAIEELPESAMEGLLSLTTLELRNCKRLVSLPTSICKLKSLDTLDLTACSSFVYFPEMLEPMQNLELLILDETKLVKKLPSSIGNLSGLQRLSLNYCEELEVVPDSIYNLTNLKTLSFCGCLELQKLPPSSSSVGLSCLQELDLSNSGILEIPDGLVCSKSLWKVVLKRTKIKSIPASVKQAFQLSYLNLDHCAELQFLPELPVTLQFLLASGCTSLKTFSLAQYWDNKDGNLLQRHYNFSGCEELHENARSSIMAYAQFRILEAATASNKFKKQNEYEEFEHLPLVGILCPGYGIPDWFSNKNEGCSMNVALPPNWFGRGFMGFALSIVVQFKLWMTSRIIIEYSFKTDNGESLEIASFVSYTNGEGCHVYVWYNGFDELVEGEGCSPDFYKLVTNVSVDFHHSMVKMCGICPLYAQDALQFDVMTGRQDESTEAIEGEISSCTLTE